MKNKRNLLIASTTLLLSAVAISIMPIVGSARGFTNGGIKSNMFKASANENGDISVEVMLTSGKNSVNTTIKGATLENDQIHIGANSYAVWTNDEDSPIRGISAFYITFAQIISFNDRQPIFYGSFNHLTFEGIQNGLYQDLQMTKLGSISSYDGGYTKNFDRIDPELTDCRYFLAVIPTGEVEFNITGFEVSTPCDDEPTREDPSIGTFSNYQQVILDKIPEEATFPFIGNGSYYYSMVLWDDLEVYLPSFKFLQTSGNAANFFLMLSQSGYVVSYTENNYRVYHKQKSGSEDYYTFEYYGSWTSSNGLTYFGFDYCGIRPSDYHA